MGYGTAAATGVVGLAGAAAVRSVTGGLPVPAPGMGGLYSVISQQGMFDGTEFLELAGDLLENKSIDGDITAETTFEEFHALVVADRLAGSPRNLKDLFVSGTNLSNPGLQEFSWLETPKVKLVDALRATMSFPFAYKPHTIDLNGKKEGEPGYAPQKFADGGIQDNLPMVFFEKGEPGRLRKGGFVPPGRDHDALIHMGKGNYADLVNPYTLGFRIATENALTKSQDKGAKITLGDIISSLMINHEPRIKSLYKHNTIDIHDAWVKTMNFNLSSLQKLAMVISGEKTMIEFLAKADPSFAAQVGSSLAAAIPEGREKMAVIEELLGEIKKILAIDEAVKKEEYETVLGLIEGVEERYREATALQVIIALREKPRKAGRHASVAKAYEGLVAGLVKKYPSVANEVHMSMVSQTAAERYGKGGAVIGGMAASGAAAGQATIPIPMVGAAIGAVAGGLLGVVGAVAGAKLREVGMQPQTLLQALEEDDLVLADAFLKGNKEQDYLRSLELMQSWVTKGWSSATKAAYDNLESALLERIQGYKPKDRFEKKALQRIFCYYVANGWDAQVDYLLKNPNINLSAKDQYKQTPLVLATYNKRYEIAQKLLNLPGNKLADYTKALEILNSIKFNRAGFGYGFGMDMAFYNLQSGLQEKIKLLAEPNIERAAEGLMFQAPVQAPKASAVGSAVPALELKESQEELAAEPREPAIVRREEAAAPVGRHGRVQQLAAEIEARARAAESAAENHSASDSNSKKPRKPKAHQ